MKKYMVCFSYTVCGVTKTGSVTVSAKSEMDAWEQVDKVISDFVYQKTNYVPCFTVNSVWEIDTGPAEDRDFLFGAKVFSLVLLLTMVPIAFIVILGRFFR